MLKLLRSTLMMLVLLTLLTGVVYPLVVTGIAQAVFPVQANGSLIGEAGSAAGSILIGQANDDPQYFWPRPSATDYGTLPSGGSNLGPTSALLAEQVANRAAGFRTANGLPGNIAVPNDMLFASASGLDPHISPDAARLQVARVARARNLDESRVASLVEEHIEDPQFGILGESRVNVLLLNMALDRLK
jgi:K+-transporting ATPase ATPase C chain